MLQICFGFSVGRGVAGRLAPGALAPEPLGPDNDADGCTLIRPPELHQLVHASPVIAFVMI
jgi:hypothetical protein